MLEVRDLLKVYKPKRGVAVTAINHVSLKFPDRGMVFLLGKSGSGKSTMLNLLGGLDSYDGGEIIIKGVSSKNFKQQHFDSYRNTYVGFIFQEYNILEEFTVGANIALAIELQGRKATDEMVNEILEQVDLAGYGNRKPNELSGGQKQRVAIARALIKNPEIIMADEPTGALDSNTGRQVFDTLKKLSKDKLIIIVSHDREFSEQYADRIIELADGNVISDVELAGEAAADETMDSAMVTKSSASFLDVAGNEVTVSDSLSLDGNNIVIDAGYHLTEEDRKAINAYMDALDRNEQLILTKKVHRYKNVQFVPTDQSKIQPRDGHDFKLIKSKLPMKNAFRIGASGLKYKKFRLVMTILLSCIAFGLFGLADTFGSFNYKTTCAESLVDSDINYISFDKAFKYYYGDGEDDFYWDYGSVNFTDEDIAEIEKDLGTKMIGVYAPITQSLMLDNFNQDAEFTKGSLYQCSYAFNYGGFAEVKEENLASYGCSLVAGKMPTAKNEIAISAYVWETYHKGGYSADGKVFTTIKTYEDMVGREVQIADATYTITGIVDTGLDFARYDILNGDPNEFTTAQEIVNFALRNELRYALNYSLTGSIMVAEGVVSDLVATTPSIQSINSGYLNLGGEDCFAWVEYLTSLDEVKKKNVEIHWIDGERTELADNEWIVSTEAWQYFGSEDQDEFLKNHAISLTGRVGMDSIDRNDIKIVGLIDSEKEGYENWAIASIVSDANLAAFTVGDVGIYTSAVGAMPKDQASIRSLVDYSREEKHDGMIMYSLQNAVTYELNLVEGILKSISRVFFFIGIGFAIFASLMLANFIGTSINYKKQDIGILRAIGSRGNDVFRIFFSESFIIAMINFALSTTGVFFATRLVNYIIRVNAGILITVLHFGIRQVGLLLVVSLGVAAIASFIPVKKIASKKPIDAIRNR